MDPALVEVPDWAASQPERVAANFTRCGPGRGEACVIDGDTIKLGNRKIRIIGIDTAEVDARCPKEAALAEGATVYLQKWLNEGPFEMVARLDDPTDRYGRELRALRRLGQDGTYRSLAAEMRDSGLARRYMGGFRRSWC